MKKQHFLVLTFILLIGLGFRKTKENIAIVLYQNEMLPSHVISEISWEETEVINIILDAVNVALNNTQGVEQDISLPPDYILEGKNKSSNKKALPSTIFFIWIDEDGADMILYCADIGNGTSLAPGILKGE